MSVKCARCAQKLHSGLCDPDSELRVANQAVEYLRSVVEEQNRKLDDIAAGCDIKKPNGLFRQVRVVIGPGVTQDQLDSQKYYEALKKIAKGDSLEEVTAVAKEVLGERY